MGVQDASFLHIEDGRNPMHIGGVQVFEGPAPTYGEFVRHVAARLPLVPRYRQKARLVAGQVGRPVWADDPNFQILYHLRHSAVPAPGGPDQLRNLAGRVFAQLLDRSKPLWEMWLVEGLADNRWAVVSKVHHSMVDGKSASDLLTVLFGPAPEQPSSAPGVSGEDWSPGREPSGAELLARAVWHGMTDPVGELREMPSRVRAVLLGGMSPKDAVSLVASLGAWRQRVASSLNGPIGPHRRWSWAETHLDDIKAIRRAFGGSVNDVVLASISAGFRSLLLHRGEAIAEGVVVRTLVPVSVRGEAEVGTLGNRVSVVFPGLPVSIADPVERLRAITDQMNGLKESKQALAADLLVTSSGFVAPMLLARGTRFAFRLPQRLVQTGTTNVPGPQTPLSLFGRRMLYAYPYAPIQGQIRIVIAIYSYCGGLFYGVTGDYDGVPDINVLCEGIEHGVDELRERAKSSAALDGHSGRDAPGDRGEHLPAREVSDIPHKA
jgi:diacylglycerol O-acyltransferase